MEKKDRDNIKSGGMMEKFKFSDMNLLEFGHNILIGGVVYSGNGKNYICLLPHDGDLEDEFCALDLSHDE